MSESACITTETILQRLLVIVREHVCKQPSDISMLVSVETAIAVHTIRELRHFLWTMPLSVGLKNGKSIIAYSTTKP